MNQQDNFEEFLSRQLKAKQPYLADEGFTDQVLQALPNSKSSPSWFARSMVGLAILVIGVAVLDQLPLVETWLQLWEWFSTAELISLLKVGGAISGGILLICFGWLAREMGLV